MNHAATRLRARAVALGRPPGSILILPGRMTIMGSTEAEAPRQRLTLRQPIRSQGGGGNNHRAVIGTPEQIAGSIETWFRSGAADGFNLMPDALPSGTRPFRARPHRLGTPGPTGRYRRRLVHNSTPSVALG